MRGVVRGDSALHAVTLDDADVEAAHAARQLRGDLATQTRIAQVTEGDADVRRGQKRYAKALNPLRPCSKAASSGLERSAQNLHRRNAS